MKARVEPLLVPVERVRVLHDELADADEPAARTRLVPVLDREVVPDLRQLLVRADLTRVEGERLLVRHREDEPPAGPIGDTEDLGVVAAGLLPQLGRRQHRAEPLLAADRVHLLADDLDDVLVNAPAEREEAPHPGAELPDEAAAHEELVADRLGVGGILAQGRKEEGRSPSDHRAAQVIRAG